MKKILPFIVTKFAESFKRFLSFHFIFSSLICGKKTKKSIPLQDVS